MSAKELSPLPSGYRTPPTPGNNPTILDDQIPYLSLCQTDVPLLQYSTAASRQGLPASLSRTSCATYPYLYSTPPTAFPETPLNGVSVFTAAQESQNIFVGHDGNTGIYCGAYTPGRETLTSGLFSEYEGHLDNLEYPLVKALMSENSSCCQLG